MPSLQQKQLLPTLVVASTGMFGLASSAWAQVESSCAISLNYVPAIAAGSGASAVPGLTLLGTATLGLLIAAMAWRQRRKGVMHRIMASAGLTAALALGAMGSSPLIDSVRAAGPYEFNNASGGTVADNQIDAIGPVLPVTVSNTSGVRVRITANLNAEESGTCKVNAEIAPGSSCTALPVCTSIILRQPLGAGG